MNDTKEILMKRIEALEELRDIWMYRTQILLDALKNHGTSIDEILKLDKETLQDWAGRL